MAELIHKASHVALKKNNQAVFYKGVAVPFKYYKRKAHTEEHLLHSSSSCNISYYQ